MDQADIKPSLKLRAVVILDAMVMLVLWGSSSIPLFSLFYATLTLVPLGVSALIGGISGHEKGV